AELRGRRQERAAACASDQLARYEGLRRAHSGRAVAEVREEVHEGVRGYVCQSCRVKLIDVAYQRARAAHDLVLCSNCGRILYIP
ncbi:MAG: hypothetical protein IVW57_17815, partial [Ktedonobacterales bacterium]|nr:hypothetical protein [Ktedonobacterales bacterium]